jgi:hypothetical protein
MNDKKTENLLSCKTKTNETKIRKIKNSKASLDERDLFIKARFFCPFHT